MGAFESSADIYSLPIINMVHDVGDKRAGHDLLRESIFLRLLSYSASDYQFVDANHFSRVAQVPDKQAALVWDLCQKEGVLRPVGDGFSARMWLAAQGRLVQKKAIKPQIKAIKKTESPKPKTEVEPLKVQETESPNDQSNDKEACEVAPLSVDREIKEFVRPNVRLSRKEIISLREQFSDEEISKMLDKLSDYKTSSGRQYSSDYQAIMRWGYKTLRESKINVKKPPVSFDIPDWMLGAEK